MKSRSFRSILPLFLFAALLPSCSDDEDTTVIRHSNPVWSPDGTTIVYGYKDADSPAASADMLPARILIHDVSTRRSSSFPSPSGATQPRYWFDRSGESIVFITGWLTFLSRTGSIFGTYTLTRPITVIAVSFSPDSNAFLLAGMDGARMIIARVGYPDKPWIPTSERTLKDTVITGTLLDIEHTGGFSYAVNLSDGKILEFDFNGNLLSRFTIPPKRNANAWQTAVRYNHIDSNTRKLFVISDTAFMSFDLKTKAPISLLVGDVVRFDANAGSKVYAFETTSGDTWVGVYLPFILPSRVPQFTMARFSPDGKLVAGAARINNYSDSLSLRRVTN